MEVTTFDQWVNTLSTALDRAKALGMSPDMIQRSAVEVGNYLYSTVDPDVPENRVLKAMWEVANEPEKEAIASTLVRLCERHGKH
ncbi:MAG: DUF3243 domain-containing protein [Clostridia bacterium]|nr:DUF3243 domain-containing protein [Clostridia bacterium]MBC7348131.1 DUF3243 domain-containing protein [Clostridia bacterium]